VLIIDDDVMVRTLIGTLLEKMGCHCKSVATGADAIAEVARAAIDGPPFDLVLLDRNLSQETGEQVCRGLRISGLDVPVVAMSGDGFTLDAELRDAGFNAAMKKPFSVEELYACVEGNVGRPHGIY
jgi:DNA-binding response OmpR family regulator